MQIRVEAAKANQEAYVKGMKLYLFLLAEVTVRHIRESVNVYVKNIVPADHTILATYVYH